MHSLEMWRTHAGDSKVVGLRAVDDWLAVPHRKVGNDKMGRGRKSRFRGTNSMFGLGNVQLQKSTGPL